LGLLGLSVVTALGVGEILIRCRGEKPAQTSLGFTVEPANAHLYRRDESLGYAHVPNQRISVTLPCDTHFTITTTRHGRRATRLAVLDEADALPEIWIFGCSFTLGWGLNDDQTFPWLLQQGLPEYNVENFGVSGYSTLQSLIQFEEQLAAGRRPALVVLAYASFHDERNTMGPFRRKAVGWAWQNWGEAAQPYATMDATGRIARHRSESYLPWVPFTKLSALAEFLEWKVVFARERHAARTDHRHEISQRLVAEFAQLSRDHGASFVLAEILGGDDMVGYCAQRGIRAGDISAPLGDPGMIIPCDVHPNAKANQIVAARLEMLLFPLLAPGPHH